MFTAFRGGVRALCGLLLLSVLTTVSPARAGSAPLRTEPLEIITKRGVSHFTVEIAETDATRQKGLMFRRTLAADRGMLFDFKAPQPVSFWMKNTLIPLDMIFIDKQGRIVSIASDAQPMSEVPIPSQGAVLGVLEIPGGRAAQIGVQPGDRVKERIFGR